MNMKTNKGESINEKYPSLIGFKKYCEFKDTEETVTKLFRLWSMTTANSNLIAQAVQEKYPVNKFCKDLDSFVFPYDILNEYKIDRPILFDLLLYSLTDIKCDSKHTVKEYAYYLYDKIIKSIINTLDSGMSADYIDYENKIIHITPRTFVMTFRTQFPYIMIDEIRADIDTILTKENDNE